MGKLICLLNVPLDGFVEAFDHSLDRARFRRLVHPVVLGAGTPFFTGLETTIRLGLTATRSFASGVVYVGYAACDARLPEAHRKAPLSSGRSIAASAAYQRRSDGSRP
jgi:hypothetical protein